MVHGTVKGLLGLISTVILIVLAAMAVCAWRLSQGPVSLSFLTPTIEQALGRLGGAAMRVTLENTALVWDADAQSLIIRVRNMHLTAPDGHSLASVPDATISLAGEPMLVGRVAVRRVRLIHPRLRLLRTEEGSFALGFGDDADANTAALLDRAIGGSLASDGKDVGVSLAERNELDQIEIVGGQLDFEDQALDMDWHAPQLDLLLKRTATGVTGHLHGPLTVGGQAAAIDVTGVYSSQLGNIAGSAKWSGIRPSYFARMFPARPELARIQILTAGGADFIYDLKQGLNAIAFDVNGGAGILDAAPWIDAPLRVGAVALKGALTDGMTSFSLESLKLDLGGPKLAVTGKAQHLGAAPSVDVALHFEDFPVDTAKVLWPTTVAINARAWINANLSGGMVKQADLKFAFASPPENTSAAGETQLQSMSGQVHGEGIAVHYFGALPSARNVAADLDFDQDTVTIAIKSGVAGSGIQVKGGTVKISGIGAVEQDADIDVGLTSSVREALHVLDTKPLDYASSLGFDPDHAQGDAAVSIDLAMPLAKTVHMSQVKLRAKVHTTGLAIPKAAFGLDLADGALDLDVDPKGMEVQGTAELGHIPIDLKWRENFGAGSFRSRYNVKAKLTEEGRKAIGLDDPALQAPVLMGTVPVAVSATFADGGHGDVDIDADLGPAALRLPSLNWSKPEGTPGEAKVKMHVNKTGIAAVDVFDITAAGGMQLRGDIAFDPGSQPRRITLVAAKFGHSDFHSTITFKPEKEIHVEVSGASFDASELVSGGQSPGSGQGSVSGHLEEGQKLTVEVKKLGRVWLSDDGSMQSVDATMSHANGQWNLIRFNATVGQSRAFHVEVKPASEKARRTLRVTCDDAGAAFGAFGILDNVRGGNLSIDGTYLDSYPGKPLQGTINLSTFRVVKAPLVARILTVAALTGAGDILSGDGIHFSKGEAQFTLADDIVTFKEAHASGTELGVTAKGQIDLANNQLALAGTIVPAYAINSVLGGIPIIGNLFTGEKGGGLFGVNYSVRGPFGNADVSVNPLSALTPGFLRGLFGIFDDSDGPKVSTQPKPRSGSDAAPDDDKPKD